MKVVHIFPKKTRKLIKFFLSDIRAYIYDIKRYLLYSKTTDVAKNQKALISQIVARYHVIEKGLTMPETRMGFGKENILALINDLEIYVAKKFDTTEVQFRHAISVLAEYLDFHNVNNFVLEKDVESGIEKIINTISQEDVCKQKEISSAEYFSHQNSSFKDFALSRKSVRNFSTKDVKYEKIKEAINIAQYTPSACNRQPSRVHIVDDKILMKKVLDLQGGNRGFGHTGNKILIVTGELAVFAGASERNEVYTNVGLFSMGLLYALHYQGIGSCVLNWSKTSKTDRELRKIIPIPNSETVVMMILIGYPSDDLKIACSMRDNTDSIVTRH